MRRLTNLRFAEKPVCIHCEAPFEKPYQRLPEMEIHGETCVLACPLCGCMTVFRMVKVR